MWAAGQGAGCGAGRGTREARSCLHPLPPQTTRPLGTRSRTLQAGARARPGDTPAGAPGASLQPGLPKVLFVRCRRTPGERSTMSLLPFFSCKMYDQSRTFPFHWRFLGRSWTPSKSTLRGEGVRTAPKGVGLRLKASHYRARRGSAKVLEGGEGARASGQDRPGPLGLHLPRPPLALRLSPSPPGRPVSLESQSSAEGGWASQIGMEDMEMGR